MTTPPPRPPSVLPTADELARENSALRTAIGKEIDLLEHWAGSIGPVRPAQGIRIRQRRDELRKLLNPAARPTRGVPRGMRLEA